MKRISLIALLLITQMGLVLGEVYVKNKPFKGETAGTGAATLVEAEVILKALEISDFSISDGNLVLGETTLPLQGKLVSLKQLADAVGAKVIVNSDFGTVDVYQGVKKGAIAAAPDPVERKPAQPGYMKPPQGWLTSWDQAQAEAKRLNRPILLNFTGSDWCGWCIKLKKEVFSTDTFKQWADKNVVLMEVDFPKRTELPAELKAQNEQLAQQFRVTGYPTIMFTDPQGNPTGRYGYDEGGPENWIKNAESQMGG